MSDFGPIVDQVRLSPQHDSRGHPITRVIWHHQASTNDDGTISMMVSGSKQVSSTYTVDNKDYGGRGRARITGVVPERYRPWTSSSWADEGALTIEVCNSSGDPTWGIADVTHESCAYIAAYAYLAYGVQLHRAHTPADSGHLGHKEVMGMFGDSYATACPMNVNIDRIIARAIELLHDRARPPVLVESEDHEMSFRVYQDPRSPGQFAIGADWAIGMESPDQTAVWLTLPDCADPGVVVVDETHWDQLTRRIPPGRWAHTGSLQV